MHMIQESSSESTVDMCRDRPPLTAGEEPTLHLLGSGAEVVELAVFEFVV